MTTASLLSNPIACLWREARAWLAELLSDFISPAYVARAIARTARTAFRKRLQLLEALVMKLLLIEASRFHRSRGRGVAAGPGPMNPGDAGERASAAVAAPVFMASGPGATRQSGNRWPEHPDHPITWRVRFHARIPRQRASAPASTRRARRAPACPQTLARRLARRFEALRRVIADPRRAIAALARKLRALGAAARAVAHRIALAAPRQGGGSVFAHATVHAHDAIQSLPCDTS